MSLFILLDESNICSLDCFSHAILNFLNWKSQISDTSISNLFSRLLVFLKFSITFISFSWILVAWETLSSEGWYYIANHDGEQVTFLILLLRMHLC